MLGCPDLKKRVLPFPPSLSDQVKSVVMINCGGALSVLELLEPENEEARFFIIDSRRPLELDNVYNQDQVILVVREGDELDVPEFDKIYSSDMVRFIYTHIVYS